MWQAGTVMRPFALNPFSRWILSPTCILSLQFLNGGVYRMPLEHKGKVALITGANKGIGFEVARQLGAEGVTVLIGARNPHLGEIAEARLKAEGTDAHFIELEVTPPEMIAKAA